MQPKSAYDRYRDAQRDRLRGNILTWNRCSSTKDAVDLGGLGEAARAPYVQQARRADAWQEAQGVQPALGRGGPRKPPSVFDLWSRATKPRVIGAQKSGPGP